MNDRAVRGVALLLLAAGAGYALLTGGATRISGWLSSALQGTPTAPKVALPSTPVRTPAATTSRVVT